MKTVRCSLALVAALAAGSCIALPVLAQGSKPAAPAALDTRIVEMIERARRVIGDTQSLNYTARVTGAMPDGNRQSVVESTVVAERGDENGIWKLRVDGTFAIEPKGGGKRETEGTIQAAFDGKEVVVLDTRRRLARIDNTDSLERVRVNMNQGNAANSVAWELFGEKPLNGCDIAVKAEIEGTETVDGLECDVVWFVPPKTKSGAGTIHDTAVVPSKIYFARRDGVPRRFEIFRPAVANAPADKRGEPTRSVTLSGLTLKTDLSGQSFSLDIPEGYSVTDSDGKRRNRQPKPDPTPATTQPTPAPSTPAPAAPTTYKWPLLPSASDVMRIGTQAPAFMLTDFDGKPVKLDDFKGKVLVLDFWGTWCPPCRASMPAVQKVHEKYKDRGVVVLGMNSESNPKANPKKFKEDNKITYGSVTKAETVSGLYKVQGWPTFYVIGKDGKVVWGATGLSSPPGGGGGAAAQLEYLESNLSQAIDKALEAK